MAIIDGQTILRRSTRVACLSAGLRLGLCTYSCRTQMKVITTGSKGALFEWEAPMVLFRFGR